MERGKELHPLALEELLSDSYLAHLKDHESQSELEQLSQTEEVVSEPVVGDGELSSVPITVKELLNIANKEVEELTEAEQYLVWQVGEYDSEENREMRTIIFRLYLLLLTIISGTMIFVGAGDLSLSPESDVTIQTVYVCMLAMLFCWYMLEDEADYLVGYDSEFLRGLIEFNFGKRRQRYNQKIENTAYRLQLTTADDYSVPVVLHEVRKQRSKKQTKKLKKNSKFS